MYCRHNSIFLRLLCYVVFRLFTVRFRLRHSLHNSNLHCDSLRDQNSRIRLLITRSHKFFNNQQQLEIRRWTIKVLIIVLISMMIHFTHVTMFLVGVSSENIINAHFFTHISKSNGYHHLIAILILFNYVIFHANTFTISTVIYTFFVYLIYKTDESFYKRFRSQCPEKMFSPSSLYKLRIEIEDMRLEFSSIFSIFPFLWFSYLFFSFSGIIIITMSSTSNVSQHWTSVISEWIMFSLFVTCVVTAVLYSDHLNTKARGMARDFANHLVLQDDGDLRGSELLAKQQRISELSNYSMNLNAWSMFSLNRGLLLSFTGSLISFSVLFAGLTSENKSINDEKSM